MPHRPARYVRLRLRAAPAHGPPPLRPRDRRCRGRPARPARRRPPLGPAAAPRRHGRLLRRPRRRPPPRVRLPAPDARPGRGARRAARRARRRRRLRAGPRAGRGRPAAPPGRRRGRRRGARARSGAPGPAPGARAARAPGRRPDAAGRPPRRRRRRDPRRRVRRRARPAPPGHRRGAGRRRARAGAGRRAGRQRRRRAAAGGRARHRRRHARGVRDGRRARRRAGPARAARGQRRARRRPRTAAAGAPAHARGGRPVAGRAPGTRRRAGAVRGRGARARLASGRERQGRAQRRAADDRADRQPHRAPAGRQREADQAAPAHDVAGADALGRHAEALGRAPAGVVGHGEAQRRPWQRVAPAVGPADDDLHQARPGRRRDGHGDGPRRVGDALGTDARVDAARAAEAVGRGEADTGVDPSGRRIAAAAADQRRAAEDGGSGAAHGRGVCDRSPGVHLSLASVLQESALRRRDKVAAVQGDRRVTYAQLWDAALRRAAALADLGVQPGDRVALLGLNTIEFVEAYYGILARGAVVVPVAPMLMPDEIAFLLADSGARLALVADDLVDVVAQGAREAGAEVLRFGDPAATAAEPAPAREACAPLDPAVLFYTSGTTGRPKGAVLTHLNLVLNAFTNAYTANHLLADDVMFGCLPLFHTFGQTVALNGTFLVGGTLILQPRFEAQEALELMVRHEVTAFLGVPTMYMALLAAAGTEAPVPRLRLCVSGGAPLPVATLEAFNSRFGARIQEGYGLSETSPTATVNQLEFGVEPGSIGHPIWGVEAEIADAEIEDRIVLLEQGEVGEIVIRGHNVFAGYHERPDATAAAIVDGWFRSGDLGTKDRHGFLRIVDRKKDLILRGGYNVYPREVEEVLVRHPAVEQAAVVGIPHDTHGEEVLAVIVPDRAAAGGDPDPEELLAWIGERVGRHKRPRLVQFVDELPH